MTGGGRRGLELRRQQLLIRSAELRVELATQLRPLAAPLALADQVRSGFRWLLRHPEVTVPALVVLVVMRPVRVLRWASTGWSLWATLRRVRKLLPAPPR